jgi:hypothetical protein
VEKYCNLLVVEGESRVEKYCNLLVVEGESRVEKYVLFNPAEPVVKICNPLED